jgi:hypothetical protein
MSEWRGNEVWNPGRDRDSNNAQRHEDKREREEREERIRDQERREEQQAPDGNKQPEARA